MNIYQLLNPTDCEIPIFYSQSTVSGDEPLLIDKVQKLKRKIEDGVNTQENKKVKCSPSTDINNNHQSNQVAEKRVIHISSYSELFDLQQLLGPLYKIRVPTKTNEFSFTIYESCLRLIEIYKRILSDPNKTLICKDVATKELEWLREEKEGKVYYQPDAVKYVLDFLEYRSSQSPLFSYKTLSQIEDQNLTKEIVEDVLRLAMCYQIDTLEEECAECMRNLIQKEPQLIEPYAILAFTLDSRKVEEACQQGIEENQWSIEQKEKACEYIFKAYSFRTHKLLRVLLYPLIRDLIKNQRELGNPYALVARAKFYINEYQQEQAQADINHVLEIDPENQFALALRSTFETSDWYNALHCVEEALNIHPECPEALTYKAWFLFKLGQQDEALSFVQKALEIAPEYTSTKQVQGMILQSQGKTQEALNLFNEIIKQEDKHYALPFYWRGIILQQQGRINEALEDFNQAISIDNKDVSFYQVRGKLFLAEKNYTKALEDFNHYLSFRPNVYEILFLRANCQLLLKRLNLAWDDLNLALDLCPVDKYSNRLRIQLKRAEVIRAQHLSGNKVLADTHQLEEILKDLNAHDFKQRIDYLCYCGYLHLLLKQIDEATKNFEEVLKIDSTSFFALTHLGEILHLQGKRDEALKRYEYLRIQMPLKHNIGYEFIYVLTMYGSILSEKEEDRQEALNELNNVLNINSQHRIALYNRGVLFYQMEKYEEAFLDLNRLLEKISPNHSVTALVYRGDLFRRRNCLQEAKIDLQQALEQEPNNLLALTSLGRTLYQSKEQLDRDQAFQILNKILSLHPHYIPAYEGLSEAYRHQGQLDLALDTLSRALTIQPINIQLRMTRASVAIQVQKLDLALQDANEVLKTSQNNIEALAIQGEAYRILGQLDKALPILDYILERHIHIHALLTRGLTNQQRGRFELALGDFKKILIYYPNYNLALVYRADLYLQMYMNSEGGQHLLELAEADIQKALKVDSACVKAYVVKSRILCYAKKLEEALETINQALSFNPGYISALAQRGYIYSLQGNQEAALNDLDRVIQKTPKDVFALTTLAGIYFTKGEQQKAQETIQLALSLDTKNITAQSMAARILLKRNPFKVHSMNV